MGFFGSGGGGGLRKYWIGMGELVKTIKEQMAGLGFGAAVYLTVSGLFVSDTVKYRLS